MDIKYVTPNRQEKYGHLVRDNQAYREAVIKEVLEMVLPELTRATTEHKQWNSEHEGYAFIKEELEELWDEIKKKEPDNSAMRSEAAHVAVTALRFLIDVCEVGKYA